jgi:hypothetical protein
MYIYGKNRHILCFEGKSNRIWGVLNILTLWVMIYKLSNNLTIIYSKSSKE